MNVIEAFAKRNSGLKCCNKTSFIVCPDIMAGLISCSHTEIYFSVKKRYNNKSKLGTGKRKNKVKTIVIVLESPHVDEFASCASRKYVIFYDDEITATPAIGKTGDKLQKFFEDKVKKTGFIDENTEYRVILMNSVQYQCSLGYPTNKYRDHVWLDLWFNYKLRDDFKKRLASYHPDFIVNCCTKGNHTAEVEAPNGTKTLINREYLDYCCIPKKVNPATLHDYVQDAIDEYVKESKMEVKTYKGTHPYSWRDDKEFDLIA